MAIEAYQFTEKDELLAKFYTLRAGLSVIAEENNSLRIANDELKKLKQENDSGNYLLEREYKELSYSNDSAKRSWESKKNTAQYDLNKNDYLGRIVRLSNVVKKLKEEKYICENTPEADFRTPFRWGKWFLLAFGIFVAFDIICLAGLLEMLEMLTENLGFSELGFVVVFFLVLICLVIVLPTVIILKEKKNSGKINKMNKLSEITDSLKKAKNNLENSVFESEKLEKTIAECDEQIERLSKPLNFESDSRYNKLIPQIEQLKTNINKSVVPTSTQRVKEIKKALQVELQGIITEPDWENVDLLIFYLSTGRADSLKEALLLVDKQRQTDQIANAIAASAKYISNTVSENTFKLGTLLHTHFTKLSRSIDDNFAKISTDLNAVSSGLDLMEQKIGSGLDGIGKTIISTQNDSVLRAERLNEALISESKRSSQELINELRYNQKYWRT